MFARNHQLIRDTFVLLKELQRSPRRKRLLALRIQENLIKGITKAERRVRANKQAASQIRGSLCRPGNDRAASKRLKRRLDALQQAIEEQQALISMYRDIGDGLAFIYIDRFDLKPLCNKPPPGAITGKKGSRLERAILRRTFDHGAITILNDLTNSIRHGDLTVVGRYGLFRLIEAKSGAGGNRERAERQAKAAKDIMDYLTTDVREFQGAPMIRTNLTCRPRYHLNAFNRVVRELRSKGTGWEAVRPEPGLTYVAVAETGRVDEFIGELRGKRPTVVFWVNDAKGAGCAYFPLPLIFDDVDDAIAFYQGQFVVMVFADFAEVATRLGVQARETNDEAWPLEFISPGEERPQPIGNHFLGRVGSEMMSPRTVVRVATSAPDEATLALMEAEAARRGLAAATESVTSGRSS